MPKKSKLVTIPLKPILHILCEGSKTEPQYFYQYISRFCRVPVRVKVEKTKRNTPLELVKEAIKLKKKSPSCDVFWIVYDRESEINCSEYIHQQVRDIAKTNGIQIAISNICFEVWLLLHYTKSIPQCDSCLALTNRREFQENFPRYLKNAEIHFSREDIDNARENAKEMNQRTISGSDSSWNVPSKWNPYTNVYEVLDSIDRFTS